MSVDPTIFAARDHISDEIAPEPQTLPRVESQRTHGTCEVVDGMPTYWVRLQGPDGPLVPVRRSP